jgi:Kef-type K+ transport system membrane component KefB
MSAFELSVHFFLQLAIILVVCRVVSRIVTWLGQPPVVAEMLAGVILGPSPDLVVRSSVFLWIIRDDPCHPRSEDIAPA